MFDGADGSQMACWECREDAEMADHAHEIDESFVVIEGSSLLLLRGRELRVSAGQECHNAKGTRVSVRAQALLRGRELRVNAGQECLVAKGRCIAGRARAGTRTIHVFGGRQARRAPVA